MLHLIAYDIASDKRLRRVARICEDFGVRVERSVFECDMTGESFSRLWTRLTNAIDEDVDKVVDYPIGLIDRNKILTLGSVVHNESQTTYVF